MAYSDGKKAESRHLAGSEYDTRGLQCLDSLVRVLQNAAQAVATLQNAERHWKILTRVTRPQGAKKSFSQSSVKTIFLVWGGGGVHLILALFIRKEKSW